MLAMRLRLGPLPTTTHVSPFALAKRRKVCSDKKSEGGNADTTNNQEHNIQMSQKPLHHRFPSFARHQYQHDCTHLAFKSDQVGTFTAAVAMSSEHGTTATHPLPNGNTLPRPSHTAKGKAHRLLQRKQTEMSYKCQWSSIKLTLIPALRIRTTTEPSLFVSITSTGNTLQQKHKPARPKQPAPTFLPHTYTNRPRTPSPYLYLFRWFVRDGQARCQSTALPPKTNTRGGWRALINLSAPLIAAHPTPLTTAAMDENKTKNREEGGDKTGCVSSGRGGDGHKASRNKKYQCQAR